MEPVSTAKKLGDLTPKEQLLEFIKGPCAPVILIPGLFSSRLTVTIDCETLQTKNPDIFASCGWSTCSSWKFWKSKPEPYYNIWISDFTGPMSLIWNSTVTCWGNLIQMTYNPDEPDITKKFLSPEGVNISVFGEDPYTKDQADCGFNAATNLLPIFYQNQMTKGFYDLSVKLALMGYQKGLTLFAAPYDWRKTTLANRIALALNNTVKQIYNMTGKATVIVAHSLGNFGALYFLNSLTPAQKEKYIANYVAVTPPLAGAPKATKIAIGGDYEFMWHQWGLNFYGQKKIISGEESIIDLQPKDTFIRYANQTWMKELMQRIELEDNYSIYTPEGRAKWEELSRSGNYPFNWFPSPLENCTQGFTQRMNHCGLNMYNWSATPIATIEDKNFSVSTEDLADIFEQYVTMIPPDNYEYFLEDTMTNNVYLLQNPEVPVTIIYGSHLYTERSFIWDYNPVDYTTKDEFAIPTKTIMTQGDGTVPVTSALLPGIKWAWEYDNKDKINIPHAKPVKIAEFCSNLNARGTIYDDLNEDGQFKVTKNEYMGVSCACKATDDKPIDGSICDHADIVGDAEFVKFIANIAFTNQRIEDVTKTGAYSMSEDKIKDIMQHCPTVNVDITFYEDNGSVEEAVKNFNEGIQQ